MSNSSKTVEELLPMVEAIARKRSQKTRVPFDDLYQQGCVALCEAHAKWKPDGPASIDTFCYSHVFWVIYELAHPRRTKKRQEEVLLEVPIKEYQERGFDAVDNADEVQVLIKGRLSGRQKEVIDLRLQGFNLVEIANKLGVSKQAVKSLQNRAFENVRV